MEALVFALVPLALTIYVLGAPIVLWRRLKKQTEQVETLRRQLAAVERDLADLQNGAPQVAGAPEPPPADAPEPEAPEPEAPEPEAPVEVPAPDAIEEPTEEDAEVAEPELARAARTSSIPEVTRPRDTEPEPEAETPPPRSVEETLASKWMVWLGAIALGLSAVFLFRYAVDQGWLTPLTRVILGLLLGGGLLAAGEWARQNPVQAVARAVNPDLVPPALTGTGLFAIFVSIYAAHALFGLLGPTTAFIALGLVAYAALALSLRHGPFVALLGLSAGYLVPALIEAPEADALPLFLYLFMLTAGCLLTMVWRKWWWFAYFTLAGAFLWPLVWLAETWTIADQGVIGTYAVGLAALFALLAIDLPDEDAEASLWRRIGRVLRNTAGFGYALAGILTLLIAEASDFNAAGFGFLGLYAAIALAVARWRSSRESLIIIAALVSLLAFLAWPPPIEVSLPERVQELGTGTAGTAFGPFVMPPEFYVFSRALWGFAALFGIGGFVGLWTARAPGVWSGVSAAMPLLLFVIGYGRIGDFEIDIGWASVAVGLAILALAAATAVGRAGGAGRDTARAFYAAACTAAIALAFACVLREAWLTVAISLEVLALAWIWSQIPVRGLRTIASLVVLVVIIRLVLNPAIIDYEGSVLGLFGWVLYGYGIPALAIGLAARIFARSEIDLTVTLCEIAAVGLAFLLVAMQLRLWTAGRLDAPDWTLFDQAIQSIWWLTAAGMLLRTELTSRRRWARPIGLIVLIVATATVVVSQVFLASPLVTGEPVGTLPLLNVLALAYLIPALQFLAIGGLPGFALAAPARRVLLVLAGGLIFLYLSLEVRRAFAGPSLADDLGRLSNAEIYTYSAVWTVYALALLAIGIRRRSQPLRYASLVVLLVTVAKVFLFDMSDLTGLFRVASFLGLGLTLIGIARVYQRFVFRPPPTA